ncbi:MAG TPA: AMP-binding protein [Bacteroidota bacterium]|nr:AMP-binding protein [Bacteroidota bacterium]
MQRTIPRLFETSVEKFRTNILLWEKKDDVYKGMTYLQTRSHVHDFAAGLLSFGVKKGDRIALIAEGRNDWVISELGILYTGAVNVPLSVKLNEQPELKFRLAHSGCRMAIVSATQACKIKQLKSDLPDLEKIILLDQAEKYDDDEIPLEELYETGQRYLDGDADSFRIAWESLLEGDPANICYTSGTTADPKGIILTHRNYTSNVEQASGLLKIPQHYCSLLILPWDHCFAHTAGIYTLMKNGASMASVQTGKTAMESLKNIPTNIKESKPTFLLSVPTLAKNFRKNIENGIKEKGPKVEKLFKKALEVAYDYNGNGWNRGKGLRILKKPLYMIFDKILFSRIRENFGGRLEFFIGGGALLDIELQRFFYAIGIPMYQGYGLSESSPVISANVPQKHKLGSSGSVVPNLELKICDDKGNALPVGQRGEIVVKGENVMAGYWKNEKATRETIREGWLYTGDLGYLDEDGFLYVLGRNKSLLIANDGEKYSPEGIEETVAGYSRFIEQILLYNNQSPYTVGLVVPNRDNCLQWLKEKQLSCRSTEGQEAVLHMLESEIDAYRDGGGHAGMFPSRWLPSAVAVLGEGFTEQNGFMNSTMKMVRGRITEFYKNRLDFLFTPEGQTICNHQNMTIVKRWEE